MQLLTNSSEEGQLPGLGWIKAKTMSFPQATGLKVPHMDGDIAKPSSTSPLLVNVGFEPRYYFVHSFCVKVENNEHSIMRTYYSWEFDSAIAKGKYLWSPVSSRKESPFWNANSKELCRFIINMLRNRIIPALLLRDESLVKTTQFGKFTYVGDPANTVRIFNELEVDELLFLDINSSRNNRGPNLNVLRILQIDVLCPLGMEVEFQM